MYKLKLTNKQAFSMLEVVLAFSVFIVVMGAVMEALWSSNVQRKHTEMRIQMRQDTESIMNWMSESLANGKILVSNVDEGVWNELTQTQDRIADTEYSYIQWTPMETDEVGEIISNTNQEMSFSNMQQMFPYLSDTFVPTQSSPLSFFPDDTEIGVNVDKNTFKGFVVVHDKIDQIVYLGMSFTRMSDNTPVTVSYTTQVILRQDINQD